MKRAGNLRAALLVNRTAGPGRPGNSGPNGDDIRRIFLRHGFQVRIYPLEPGQISGMVEQALETRPDLVVAGGGDGTISSIAGRLAGGPIPLGVLPLGSWNHFAKDLGMKMELTEAVGQIARGKERRIDVGEVNGRIFINNSSIGTYPHMVRERDEQRVKLGRPKWIATLIGVIKVLWKWPVYRVRIHLNGEVLDRTTSFVFVGNNSYALDQPGRGLRSCLTSGRLCVYTTRGSGPWTVIRLLALATVHRLNGAEELDSRLAREAVVSVPRRHVRVAKDGEILRLTPPIRYRIRPRALRVIAPAAE